MSDEPVDMLIRTMHWAQDRGLEWMQSQRCQVPHLVATLTSDDAVIGYKDVALHTPYGGASEFDLKELEKITCA